MDWIFSETKQQSILSPPQTSNFLHQDHHSTPPRPPPPPSTDFNLNKEVSPSILLSIIIISVIFFISGLLHLLIRILLRPSNRDPNDLDHSTDFQRQLQQLFHLHDSGVDQSLLDTLPVFNYKAIIGVKKYPFDCAVCLSEFELEDKLRLLPNCSHAFHRDCIDTWLLSHSTCPICRTSLLVGLSQNGHCLSPRVLVLESGSESAGENVSERDDVRLSLERLSSNTGFYCSDEFGSSRTYFSREIEAENDESRNVEVGSEEKVVLVKLGKFRNVDGRGGEGISSHGNNGDARRCFSMGSFAYVMDEKSLLQVPIIVPMKKESSKKGSLPLRSGHRPAMSECGFDSRREFTSFGQFKSVQIHGIGSNAIRRSKSETFSGSKNWLRLKREMPNPAATESSRRAFSFRFPVQHNVVGRDELKPKNGWNGTRRTISEIDIGRWENMGGIEIVGDHSEGYQSCNILDSHENPQSLARKTMLWLVGRKSKVVHSSFSPNV